MFVGAETAPDKYFGSLGMWSNIPVILWPATSDAKFLKIQELLMMENLDACALPSTTDENTHASQAENVHQLGVDTCRKVIMGVTKDFQVVGNYALVVLDLSTRTADMPRAIDDLRSSHGCPMFYMGLCEGEVEEQWAVATVKDHMLNAVLEGMLCVQTMCHVSLSCVASPLPGLRVPNCEALISMMLSSGSTQTI